MPASRRMGIFFPFIHVPFFPPPSFKQASRSVNVLQALGQVIAVGFWGRETDEITKEASAFLPLAEQRRVQLSKRCAAADRRQCEQLASDFLISSQVSPWPLCDLITKWMLFQLFGFFLSVFSRWFEFRTSPWFGSCYFLFLIFCIFKESVSGGFEDLQPNLCIWQRGEKRIVLRSHWAHRACLHEDGAVDTSDIFSILNALPSRFLAWARLFSSKRTHFPFFICLALNSGS